MSTGPEPSTSTATTKRGLQIRLPHTPDMLSTVAYMDKPNSVLVEPIQVRKSTRIRSSIKHSPLQTDLCIPAPVIKAFPSGAPEDMAASLGWRYGETMPSEIQAAYTLNMREGGLNKYSIILGGKPITASFPFSAFLGLEKRTAGSPNDVITCSVDPVNVIFMDNSSVSAWGPIAQVFRGSLSHAGVNHDWTAGPGVYTRYN